MPPQPDEDRTGPVGSGDDGGGACDERGTNEYNLALGERRARSAKDYLVSLGVSASRLSTISYGEERPVCSEPEESCWWQNRRAHPVVTARNNQ